MNIVGVIAFTIVACLAAVGLVYIIDQVMHRS